MNGRDFLFLRISVEGQQFYGKESSVSFDEHYSYCLLNLLKVFELMEDVLRKFMRNYSDGKQVTV
jgi:hypothetical protein